MSKIKNLRGFTDQFKELLNLSTDQIGSIDEIEFELHKEEYWNKLPKDADYKLMYLERITSQLSPKQITIFENYTIEKKLKQQKKKEERNKKSYEIQKKRLASLNLSEDQLLEFINVKTSLFELSMERMKEANSIEDLSLDKIHKVLFEEKIYPIFDEQQLKQFKEIIAEEERSKNEWLINLGKARFLQTAGIKVSDEQAKLMFGEENEVPNQDENGEYYSEFETADLEKEAYRKILTPDQFAIYETFYQKKIKFIEERFLKQNEEHELKELKKAKEYFEYYVQNVLPELSNSRKNIEVRLSAEQKGLINEIKKHYLHELKKRNIKNIEEHEKYNKDFLPNSLERYLIRNKLKGIKLDVFLLYDYQPAKKLITSNLMEIVKQEQIRLQPVYDQLKEFQIASYERNDEYRAVPVIKVPIKQGEEHLEYLDFLLLEIELSDNLKRI